MNNDKNDVLHIQMLGSFNLSFGEQEINDQDNRSKKLWILLAYTIVHRNKELSQGDYVDLMWPNEESNNPGNALKTLFHRVRAMLNSLGYISGHNLIVQDNGTYAWNKKININIDIDEFECLYKKGSEENDTDLKLEYFLAALDIYKGDFLPKLSMEAWATPINIYYHSLYISLMNEVLDILREKEAFEKIVKRCNAAIKIEPYDENLYYHLITSLVRMGNQQAALTQYENMKELFFNNFGITPSEELTALYKEVVRTTNSMETDPNVIKKYLQEKDHQHGAFYCEYEFFKNIYRLHARALARSGNAVFLGLLTISDNTNNKLPPRILKNAMSKLDNCIRLSLRQGDIYSKYSGSQYIIMLPAANYENSKMITNRITSRFRRENPHSKAFLSCALNPLDPLDEEL